jgi:hypothetical protein
VGYSRSPVVTELKLYDENESSWMIAYLGMPTLAREAWRTLAERVGVDLRSPAGAGFQKLADHHHLFDSDPAMEELLAMGREEARRRAN